MRDEPLVKVTGFDETTTVAMQELLPDIALQYGDTIRLAARPRLGLTSGDVAITEISPQGVRIDADGSSAWVDFLVPISDLEQLARATVDLAEAARDLHPDEPMTTLESVMAGLGGQRLHRGRVVDVRLLSDHLAGLRIGPFADFQSLGWDQSLTLFTMADGREVPDDLTLESWRSMATDEAPRGRTYTVRNIDPDGTLEIWVALHGDDPDTSSTWCRTCQRGDPVAILGPRGRFAEPPTVERAVLVADESAFGAAASVAGHLDPDLAITIVGVVDDADHRIDFGLGERVTVDWIETSGDAATRANAVVGHIDTYGTVNTYFWGAGEFEMTRRLRRHLRRDRAVPASQVSISAYWRAEIE